LFFSACNNTKRQNHGGEKRLLHIFVSFDKKLR
jgi:hypothetical protein